MSERIYQDRLLAYRIAMSLAEAMLLEGIITEGEYGRIDRIIAKKNGLSLSSICCRRPLIYQGFGANMTRREGGEDNGADG